MARAGPVTKQRPSLYERDFCMWIEQQAALLREGRLDEIDVANLLEEIEVMGRRQEGHREQPRRRADPSAQVSDTTRAAIE